MDREKSSLLEQKKKYREKYFKLEGKYFGLLESSGEWLELTTRLLLEELSQEIKKIYGNRIIKKSKEKI